MSFFNKFPQRNYGFLGTTLGIKRVVDITRRVVVRSYARQNQSLFIRYKLKDHESYETIAAKLYGSPKYHWILMLLNEVVDPFTDMPQKDFVLSKIVSKNYSGNSLFMKVQEFDGNFTVGETVTAKTASIDATTGNRILTDTAYTAVVKTWNPTYRELVVTNENNTSVLERDLIIVGNTSGATATFRRRVTTTEAVHHFENETTGEILNPLPNPISGETSSPLISYVESAENPGVSVITNKEYAEEQNEKVRDIRVMRPENVSQVETELETIFRNSIR